jgi:hypothetical protein
VGDAAVWPAAGIFCVEVLEAALSALRANQPKPSGAAMHKSAMKGCLFADPNIAFVAAAIPISSIGVATQ